MIEIIRQKEYADIMLQIAITHNPHQKNPNELIRKIQKFYDQKDDEYDAEGMKKLKEMMSKAKTMRRA